MHDTALYQIMWEHEKMFRLMVAGAIIILQYLHFLKTQSQNIFQLFMQTEDQSTVLPGSIIICYLSSVKYLLMILYF